jgi:hypothetical protein
MNSLEHWNLKRLIFWNHCVAECADDSEMLHKALLIVSVCHAQHVPNTGLTPPTNNL